LSHTQKFKLKLRYVHKKKRNAIMLKIRRRGCIACYFNT